MLRAERPGYTLIPPLGQRSPVKTRRCPATVESRSSWPSQVASPVRCTRTTLEDRDFAGTVHRPGRWRTPLERQEEPDETTVPTRPRNARRNVALRRRLQRRQPAGGLGDDRAGVGTTPRRRPRPPQASPRRPPPKRRPRRSSPCRRATEMLFAVGAGDQVIAVDDLSELPGGRPDHRPVRLRAERRGDRDVRARPRRAVSDDLDDVVERPGSRSTSRCCILPAAATLDDTYDQIEQLGAATGHVGEAAAVVARDADRHRRRCSPRRRRTPALTYYHELDEHAATRVTSKTFIGELYALVRAREHRRRGRHRRRAGYPQLSAEYLVEADPDLIFLADTEVLRQRRGDRRRPPRVGRPDRGRRTATWSSSTTTSPPDGARGSSTCFEAIVGGRSATVPVG